MSLMKQSTTKSSHKKKLQPNLLWIFLVAIPTRLREVDTIPSRVNNLTNNQNFITNGFEQRRFDFDERRIDKFQNKYFYGFGTNYFAMISFIFG